MTFDELLDFIAREDARLRKRFPERDEARRTLSRAVKLSEEVGELSNEVLLSLSDQRSEKLANFDSKNVGKEVADVIITTMMLARSLGVDVPQALAGKIEIIDQRYQNPT